MDFDQFVELIKVSNKQTNYPDRDKWPQNVKLHRNVWSQILKLYTYTSTDNTEYEQSFFYVDRDVIVSEPVTGAEHNVSAHHSLEVEYTVEKEEIIRRVFLDEEVIDEKYQIEVPPDEKETGFLFNMHSHPIHLNLEGERVYTFFSPADIRTLLNSKSTIIGLVTDKLWLACKTSASLVEVSTKEEQQLADLTVISMSDESLLSEKLKEQLTNWGIVIYRAEFDQDLERVV